MSTGQYIDKLSFLGHRKAQEAEHFEGLGNKIDKFASLLTVEVNTTELCNRKCVFCPRYDETVYPNRNLHMQPAGARMIAEHLREIDYQGKISFSGFSENLLNPQFQDIVRTFREKLPGALMECNTNGDKLTKDMLAGLFGAGLDFLYINLYDGVEQMETFGPVVSGEYEKKVKYRAHWNDRDHGLILNNRSGAITWLENDENTVENLKGAPCHYPFYKMFVDWNGDVLFCSNDWGKTRVVGNLIQDSVENVWFSKEMKKIRTALAKGDRSRPPCSSCNVDGRLFGKKSFDIINDYYAHGDNRN
ncbi:MAG: radical SAM/SPASM domain-containing protein [Rhodospirillales bacterium]